ncbi:MAG: hypothetical protein M3537_04815, partial [Chloroflexota bacterium]|nr:hypothetical protein [Chloroflexota bacterium]
MTTGMTGNNDSDPPVAAKASPDPKAATRQLIDDVLVAYPEKLRKFRNKHLKPNDASGTDKECEVKS